MSTSASQLKAKLGRFMRAVRAGKEIVVTDRGVPVARLVPFGSRGEPRDGLAVATAREPDAPPLGDVDVRPIRYRGPSTTELLREERDRR